MIKAEYSHKSLVVDILSKSFDENKSVNYVIKQDRNRKERIRRLMEYSFEISYLFGEIYLSDDKNACALVLFPDKKRASFKSILLDIRLAISCIGVTRILKVLERKSQLNRQYPSFPFVHLWFIGVDPLMQKKGIGRGLLEEILKESTLNGRPVYLETSMIENLSFYKKMGFEVYGKLEFEYTLYLLRS